MTTRRSFLKMLLATAFNFFFFSLFPLENNTNANLLPEPISVSTSATDFTKIKEEYMDTDKVNHQKLLTPIPNEPFNNALNHIITPTYDGSGQSVHPSVIDFKIEFDIESWGGFRYWMALTPYPYFKSALENPSLLVSQDGLNWNNPPGIKNPLEPKPIGSLGDNYNSDPELIYDPDQNTLILYWREYSQNTFEKIWAKKISPGYQETDKILCFEKPWDAKTGFILSPTVWRKNAKEWFMWTTNGQFIMHFYTSSDGITWSNGQSSSAPWNTWNGGYVPWHIEAKPNTLKDRIDFLIAGWPKMKSINDCQLFFATAPMSQPYALTMPLSDIILKSSDGAQWDNNYIYRSSFVLELGETLKLRIWYSACSNKKLWHIGYTEGTLPNIP